MRPLFYLARYRRSKLVLIIGGLIALAVLIILLLTILKPKAEGLSDFPSQGLYPSVRLNKGVPDDNHPEYYGKYDWLSDAGGVSPDVWLAQNSNIITDVYFEWIMIRLTADLDPVAKQNQYGKLYEWAAANNYDWEKAFLHFSTSDTFVKMSTTSWGGGWMDNEIRYVFTENSSGAITPSLSNPYTEQSWRNHTWNGWQANGQTSVLNLASNNSKVYFGRLEKFDEINLNFSNFASSWQPVYEYWNGSGWVPLTIINDTTNSGLQNGKVRFASPSAWKRNQVNGYPTFWGSQGVYYIRVRTNGGTGPVIDKAWGRNYWQDAADNSGSTVPAWDPANDKNNDNYIDDAEYASRANANATARFKYESRIPFHWAWSDFAIYPDESIVVQHMISGSVETLNASASPNNKFSGVFIDDLCGAAAAVSEAGGKMLEYPGQTYSQYDSNWEIKTAQMIADGRTAMHNAGYFLGGNVCRDGSDLISSNMDTLSRETWSYASWEGGGSTASGWEGGFWSPTVQWQKWGDAGKPMVADWRMGTGSGLYYVMKKMRGISETVNVVNGSVTVTGSGTRWTESVQPGSALSLGNNFANVSVVNSDTSLTLEKAWSGSTISNSSSFDFYTARDKMDGLTTFMVAQRQATDYLAFSGSTFQGNYQEASYIAWIPAVTKDYGQTTGIIPQGKLARGTRGAYVFATGLDTTTSSSKNYFIYGRDYTKALVLNRPTTDSTASYFSNSAISVDLPAGETWYPVDYFGNLGTAVTKVSLKNGEGIILMKGSTMNEITLTKSVSQSRASSGETITYTINYQVGNQAVTSAKIEDPIPSGTSFVSAANGGTSNGTTITWNLGNLAIGAKGSVSFQVKIK